MHEVAVKTLYRLGSGGLSNKYALSSNIGTAPRERFFFSLLLASSVYV
jgi:hypothetical protein